jgi:hypothetical protein
VRSLRAQQHTSFFGGSLDIDDQNVERKFSSPEELSTWLENSISALRAKGFQVVRYKANGMHIDWLNGMNLPE